MVTKSIRWRFQLWLAFLLVSILSGFGITAYQLHRTNQLGQIDDELERRVAALAGDVRGIPPLGHPPDPPPRGPLPFEPWAEPGTNRGFPGLAPGRRPVEPGPDSPPPRWPGRESPEPRGRWEDLFEAREIFLSPRTSSLFDQTQTNGYYYAVWSRGGQLLKGSTNAPAGMTHPGQSSADTSTHTRMRNSRREAYVFTEIGECVLVGRPIAADLEAMRHFAGWLIAAGGAVLALGLGGGWLLASRALRPIEVISSAASRISVGNLSERIDLADTDSELGRLATVLNSSFARLEAAFAQQKQFTADASHELRTPLAVLISEAQTALARDRSAAEYRETIEACLDTARQMTRLTQSLLELARYDAGEQPLDRRPLDLAERARACVELVRPLARERGIQIQCSLEPVEVLGDGDRLGQVITNLLINAIRHNQEGGDVHVAVGAESGTALVTVADSGPGISLEDLPHVFERFYRGDKSRTRAGGHSGLGLAICKAIVEAHGGSIEASSQPGAGTRFTVKLPGPLESVSLR